MFEAAGQTGRVTALEPEHVLAWDWADEHYRFELSPRGDGCVLVFTHVFDPALGPDWQHAAGWETYLARLDAHLAGGYLSEEEAQVGVAARMDRYRAAFAAGPKDSG